MLNGNIQWFLPNDTYDFNINKKSRKKITNRVTLKDRNYVVLKTSAGYKIPFYVNKASNALSGCVYLLDSNILQNVIRDSTSPLSIVKVYSTSKEQMYMLIGVSFTQLRTKQ